METSYIKDRVIVITGSGSGFGRYTAIRCAELGAKMVIADVVPERVKETVGMIKEAGGIAEGTVVDVSSLESNEALVKFVVDTFGGLDCFVANAGTMPNTLVCNHKAAHDAWVKCIEINQIGVLNGICAVYDLFAEQKRGHFVATSSTYALQPSMNALVYGGTKAAVAYMMRVLREEACGKFKVSTVFPSGGYNTNLGSTKLAPADSETTRTLFVNPDGMKAYVTAAANDKAPEVKQFVDVDSPQKVVNGYDDIVESFVYVINQPWGRNINEIVCRPAADPLIM